MKTSIAFLLVVSLITDVAGQHLNEFNSLFNGPQQGGRFAVVAAAAGYGYQNSEAHGFGNLSMTSHFYLTKDSEFRFGGGWGGNRKSYFQLDVNLLKALAPDNFQSYSCWIGLSRQFSFSKNLIFGFNADYAYAFKAFGRYPVQSTGMHHVIFGGEFTSKTLPISVGTNFTYTRVGNLGSKLPGVTSTTFRTWDIYCLIEIPKWRGQGLKKPKEWTGLAGYRFNAAIAFGPKLIIYEQSLATETGIKERFVPGMVVTIKGGMICRTR